MSQAAGEQDKKRTIGVFIMDGISSLLGWSVVLAALDFFQDSFTDYNIYSFISIPLFTAYLIIGCSYHYISNHFHYIQLITAGNIITNSSLVLMLIVSLTIPQTLIGYVLLLVGSFLAGIGGNLTQLTFFAMINYFSEKVVSWYTVGTALSGLLITFFRLIVIAIFGPDNKSSAPIIVYFVIGIAFQTCNILVNVAFCRSKEYKRKVDKFLVHHDESLTNGPEPAKESEGKNHVMQTLNEGVIEDSESNAPSEPVPDNFVDEEKRIESQNYFRTLLETEKTIRPYPMVIMFTFVVTFTLFPGPTLKRAVGSLPFAWSSVIMLMSYNIGDTLGKYLAEVHNIFNKASLLYIFYSRLIYLFTITVLATGWAEKDPLIDNAWFPFFNCFLFAVTNGFSISTLCPTQTVLSSWPSRSAPSSIKSTRECSAG